MQADKIHIGSLEIEVRFKAIKNLHLSVHPPFGKVTISSPEKYDLEKIKIYAATKLGWIKKEQAKLIAQNREGAKQFITRESHQFLGNRYLLKVIDSPKTGVKLQHHTLELLVSPNKTMEEKRKVLYTWYRKELRLVLDKLVGLHAQKIGLGDVDFGIRISKTKWGSCNTESKKIWFNIELAKKPIECIEYIVVHELVHLLERHHNKRFILLMDQFLPNWHIQKKILNELPI